VEYPTRWERIEAVTNVDWIVQTMRLMSLLMPCPTKLFPPSELAQAHAWIICQLSPKEHKQPRESGAPMSVMLQAFYWDCPAKEKQEYNWWNFVADHVEELSKSGFNALWLPPISKAAETRSMGYDPYDYFDLGDLD
jgi:hypothetical protein